MFICICIYYSNSQAVTGIEDTAYDKINKKTTGTITFPSASDASNGWFYLHPICTVQTFMD